MILLPCPHFQTQKENLQRCKIPTLLAFTAFLLPSFSLWECDLDRFLSSFAELRKHVGGGCEEKDHGASSFTQATNCNSSTVQSEMIRIQSLKIPISQTFVALAGNVLSLGVMGCRPVVCLSGSPPDITSQEALFSTMGVAPQSR